MVLALLAWCGAAAQELSFGEFFHDKTMRFDYIHCGDSRSEHFYFDELREELHWAGSKRSLRDTTGYGSQFFRIVDAESGREIYSRGYCTLFDEWQSTVEALAVQRSYPESVVFPYPKRPCRIEIWSRDDKGRLVKRFEQAIDPESYEVVGFTPRLESFEVAYHGAPEHRVDIVLLPEGYSEGERAKFEEACREFAREFASYSPFREQFERFNIRAVWAPSVDSGVTIPGEGIWRNTACGAASTPSVRSATRPWPTSSGCATWRRTYPTTISTCCRIRRSTAAGASSTSTGSARRTTPGARARSTCTSSATC